jgi:hypothetical protein
MENALSLDPDTMCLGFPTLSLPGLTKTLVLAQTTEDTPAHFMTAGPATFGAARIRK